MTKPTDKELIDAVNLISEYGMEELANDFQIVLAIGRGDCSLELFDPDGDEVHCDHDPGCSLLAAMCRQSQGEVDDD